jgi:hypothetical protein
MEKCKEGKVVANHVFPISSFRILYLGRAVTALHSWHVRNKMLRRCCHVGMTVKQSFSVLTWVVWFCWLATFCHGRPRYKIVSLSCQHRRNILLRRCQECSAVTARRRYKIRTLEIGNTWFATTFPSLHFSIFCQITEFPYGPGLMGHSVYHIETNISGKSCWSWLALYSTEYAFMKLPLSLM